MASALAARRGQAVILMLVALLAGAAVAAAPWYAVAAARDVVLSGVSGAPAIDRLITVSFRARTGEPEAPERAAAMPEVFHPAGFTTVTGSNVTVTLQPDGPAPDGPAPDGSGDEEDEGDEPDSTEVRLIHRDGVCQHLAVTGSCPAGPDEVLISPAVSDALGLAVGDEVDAAQTQDLVRTVRVVGTYQVVDAADPYWGDGLLIADAGNGGTEPAFTTQDGVAAYERVFYTYELLLEPAALATTEVDELASQVDSGVATLRMNGYVVSGREFTELGEQFATERRNVVLGVGVGVAVLLLLTWFTLAVVLRGAMTRLRGDVGWWRLNGAPPVRGWLAALGQGIVPLVGGAVLGLAAGLGAGQVLAGDVANPSDRQLALVLALVLAGLVVAGGLVVVVAIQVGTLRAPVRDLLRRVPARRRVWQRSLVDLLLVLVAAGAVGQALLVGRDARGVALLAPALVALAVALVAAWAVPPVVASLAARSLHAGRVATTLVTASLARRTGSHRLFSLVAVAVALVTMGFVGWDTDARTQRQRAALEIGADRVLTVDVADPARLLASVRAADPTGEAAMAVFRWRAVGVPAVLAVDSSRLGVVAGWRAEYGDEVGELAGTLRPAEPEPMAVTGDELVVAAAADHPAGEPVRLRVRLRTLDTGAPVEAVVGPLTGEPGPHTAAVPDCAVAGCRLVGVELVDPAAGMRVDLSGLAGRGDGLAGRGDGLAGRGDGEWATWADPTRWRTSLVGGERCPTATGPEPGVLRLTVPPPPPSGPVAAEWGSCWTFVVDTPVPLPVVATRWRPGPAEEERLAPLPGEVVPVELAGAAALAPSLGEANAVLVDLEYAERMAPFAGAGGAAQVWLAATAPPTVTAALAEAGVTTLDEATLDAELSRLRGAGSAVGVRFQTVVALIGLLLAAGAVLVYSAQERAGRAVELAALRAQGVAPRVVRAVGFGGLAGVAMVAAAAGIVAGLAGAAVARVLHPGFVDGWQVLPTALPRPWPVAVAVAVAAAVLGGAVLATAVGLVRRALAGARPGAAEESA